MNLKHYVKYAGYIVVISCIGLLSTNLSNGNNDNINDKAKTVIINSIENNNFAEGLTSNNGAENKKNRIIIKPSENNYYPDRNTTIAGNEARVSVPSTDNNLKVQPLPPADANAQIIVNLLK